jgi:hypothetical protein
VARPQCRRSKKWTEASRQTKTKASTIGLHRRGIVMTTAIQGGCLCGKTRYQLSATPTDLNDCHCIDCRRSSGAPFVSWGTVNRADVHLVSGELRKVPHANRIRSFAACCGTQLFFETTRESATVDVTLASLDDPVPFAPRLTIWTEDRLPWVPLDETRPTYRQDG